MIDLQESLLRHCLRPKVECDIPGRLRLRFARHALLNIMSTILVVANSLRLMFRSPVDL